MNWISFRRFLCTINTSEHKKNMLKRILRSQTNTEENHVVESCIEFFHSKDVSDVLSWGTMKGQKIVSKMPYLDKEMFRDEFKARKSLFISKDIPQLYQKYLKYAVNNMQMIFTEVSLEEYSDKYSNAMHHAQHIIGSMLVHFLNATHESSVAVETLIRLGIMRTVLCILELFYPVINEYTEYEPDQDNRLRIFSNALSVTYNASRLSPSLMHSEGTVEKVLPFLNSECKELLMESLLILSYLITEKNNERIVGSKDPMKLLLLYIANANAISDHIYMGFTLSELLMGLAQLAHNDQNKKTLVEIGAIQMINQVFSCNKEGGEESDEELLQACNVLYHLSFIQENRDKIIQEKIILDTLKTLKKSKNPNILKTVSGINWELTGKFERRKSISSLMSTQNVLTTQQTEEKQETGQQHIMISYQWDHQEIMLKVRNKLQEEGYKVWIDLDEMGGSTLEAMAGGVENAALLLITVSRKYKDSSNCRSEAEYAFKLKRPIIPLLFEDNYDADGWLGFIVGAKYWINFTDGKQIDSSLKSLVKEVKKRNISSLSKHVLANKQPQIKDQIDTTIKEWPNFRVVKWIRSIGLFDTIGNEFLQDLDGSVLVRLYKLKEESIDTFFRLLKENLRLDSLLHLFKFEEELDKLFTTHQ